MQVKLPNVMHRFFQSARSYFAAIGQRGSICLLQYLVRLFSFHMRPHTLVLTQF